MRKPYTIGTGTVGRIDYIHPEQGKPYLRVMVHFSKRPARNGSPFREKVQVRVYSRDMEQIGAALTVGDLATFHGESDAYVEVSNGRPYGNQRVIGTIVPVRAEPVKSTWGAPSPEEDHET